jgi:hypothetical protein
MSRLASSSSFLFLFPPALHLFFLVVSISCSSSSNCTNTPSPLELLALSTPIFITMPNLTAIETKKEKFHTLSAIRPVGRGGVEGQSGHRGYGNSRYRR